MSEPEASLKPANIIVSWAELDRLVDRVYRQVVDSNFKVDHVFGIHRGGDVFAVMMSHMLDVPCHVIGASHWPDDAEGEKVVWARHSLYMTKTKDLIVGHILLCDDLVDSGMSQAEGVKKIQVKFPKVEIVKTAVLHKKLHSDFEPDFVGQVIKPDTATGEYAFIDYPWERKEVLG